MAGLGAAVALLGGLLAWLAVTRDEGPPEPTMNRPVNAAIAAIDDTLLEQAEAEARAAPRESTPVGWRPRVPPAA